MAAQVQIRIAHGATEQLADLAPLYTALHRHHTALAPTLAGMPPRPVEEAWRLRLALYRRWLATPDAFVLVAEQERRSLGYALVSLTAGLQGWASGERIGEIHDLAVLPEVRGRGIGTALLDRVERELGRLGVREYRLLVLAANDAARRLYEARGMTAAFHSMVGRVS